MEIDMNNEELHNKLERACDVLDDAGDNDARDAVIEAGKLLGDLVMHKEISKRCAALNMKLHKIIDKLEWQVSEEKNKRLKAEDMVKALKDTLADMELK